MRALTFLAGRFVAGDTAADAVKVVRGLNDRGLKATLDFLGEDCTQASMASAAADEYCDLLRRIDEAELDCNVSLKLSQFGLNLGRDLVKANLLRVIEAAEKRKNFVRIDMEGSDTTDRTLDLLYETFENHPNVGIVVQSMLKRSLDDIRALNKAGIRVRLCKGAYKEPADRAFQTKNKICANFDLLVEELFKHGSIPAVATHDEKRVQAAIRLAEKCFISKDKFEFQMLYGLRSPRWDELTAAGYKVRIYVPYGTHWLPYFSRRLRERKENVLFVLRSLFGS